MAKPFYRLATISIGDIAADGGVSIAFKPIPNTVADSCMITSQDDSTSDLMIEESDAPFMTVTTQTGAYEITWESYDTSIATMITLLGGTKTGVAPNEVYSAAIQRLEVVKSVRVVFASGQTFEAVKCKITAKLELAAGRAKPGSIKITAKVLSPDKALTAPWSSTGNS